MLIIGGIFKTQLLEDHKATIEAFKETLNQCHFIVNRKERINIQVEKNHAQAIKQQLIQILNGNGSNPAKASTEHGVVILFTQGF